MALNTKLSVAAAIAACDAIVDKIDVGAGTAAIKIYDGSKPATPDVAVSSQVLLATLNLANPAFGGAVSNSGNGTATANAVSNGTAVATGTASWFRVLDRNGAAVIDGTVGTADCDLILNSIAISSGATVAVTAWTFSQPQ